MPNKDLKNMHFKCNHDVAKKHFGETVSYTNLYTTKERLESVDENSEFLNNLNSDEKKSLLDWINVTLESVTRKSEHSKKMDKLSGVNGGYTSKDGSRNAYRNSYNKPQKIDSIMAEGLNKEIESIKYLMEYMDNNNKNKLI